MVWYKATIWYLICCLCLVMLRRRTWAGQSVRAGALSICLTLRCWDPVSYTHLDVYKRQHLPTGQYNSLSDACRPTSTHEHTIPLSTLQLAIECCLMQTDSLCWWWSIRDHDRPANLLMKALTFKKDNNDDDDPLHIFIL